VEGLDVRCRHGGWRGANRAKTDGPSDGLEDRRDDLLPPLSRVKGEAGEFSVSPRRHGRPSFVLDSRAARIVVRPNRSPRRPCVRRGSPPRTTNELAACCLDSSVALLDTVAPRRETHPAACRPSSGGMSEGGRSGGIATLSSFSRCASNACISPPGRGPSRSRSKAEELIKSRPSTC